MANQNKAQNITQTSFMEISSKQPKRLSSVQRLIIIFILQMLYNVVISLLIAHLPLEISSMILDRVFILRVLGCMVIWCLLYPIFKVNDTCYNELKSKIFKQLSHYNKPIFFSFDGSDFSINIMRNIMHAEGIRFTTDFSDHNTLNVSVIDKYDNEILSFEDSCSKLSDNMFTVELMSCIIKIEGCCFYASTLTTGDAILLTVIDKYNDEVYCSEVTDFKAFDKSFDY